MTRPDDFRIILTADGGQLSGWPELPTEATIEWQGYRQRRALRLLTVLRSWRSYPALLRSAAPNPRFLSSAPALQRATPATPAGLFSYMDSAPAFILIF